MDDVFSFVAIHTSAQTIQTSSGSPSIPPAEMRFLRPSSRASIGLMHFGCLRRCQPPGRVRRDELSCLTLFSFPVRMKPDLINYNSIAGNLGGWMFCLAGECYKNYCHGYSSLLIASTFSVGAWSMIHVSIHGWLICCSQLSSGSFEAIARSETSGRRPCCFCPMPQATFADPFKRTRRFTIRFGFLKRSMALALMPSASKCGELMKTWQLLKVSMM